MPGKVWRDKRGDLQPEVTGRRSQSHRSSAGLQEQARPNRSGNAVQTISLDNRGAAPFVPNPCRRQTEKCGVGKPHQPRVAGRWTRRVQKARKA